MRILLIFMIIISTTILTGCIGVGIGSGGSVGLFIGVKDDSSSKDLKAINAVYKYAIDNGYNISKTENKGIVEIKAWKHIDNIKDYNLPEIQGIIEKDDIQLISSKEDNDFKAVVDLTEIQGNKRVISANNKNSSTEYTFGVNFSKPVRSSNAKYIRNNGKTLVWELKPGLKSPIEISFN